MSEKRITPIYSRYLEMVDADISKNTAILGESTKTIEYLEKVVNTYKDRYSEVFDKLVNLKSLKMLDDYKLDDTFKMYITSYITVRKKIRKLEEQIEFLNSLKIPQTEYGVLVLLLGTEIKTACIMNGYVFNFPSNLGQIKVVKRVRTQPKIDWKATEIEKARLEEEGISTYSKDNESGQKYFIYHDSDFDYHFVWGKKACSVRNRSAYILQFTKGPLGINADLYRHVNNNPNSHVMYDLFTSKKRKYAKRYGKLQESSE